MLGSSWRCGRREGRGSIGAMSERADLEENIARERDAVKALAETNARQHKTDPGDVLRTRPAGVRRKGRRAQGTHGPKGRAPKGAEREAPKAPSVPADVLRTRPAAVRRKGRRAEGTHGRAARLYQMMIVAV